MAKGFQGSRRHHQRSAAVPSRSSSTIAKRCLRCSDAPSRAVALRLGAPALRHGGSNRRHSAIQGHSVPERQRALALRNRQRVRRVDLRLLRRVAQALLRETWPQGSFDLAIYLVAEPEMIHLNETFLRHRGSTDVITFDYAERVGQASRLPTSDARVRPGRDRRGAGSTLLNGEIFVCLDEAVSQARRFRTTWQSELVRYVVHGALHLLGYDDLDAQAHRRMKGAEDTLVCQLARQFDFHSLAKWARNRVQPKGYGGIHPRACNSNRFPPKHKLPG